nr:hypothetical protein [bacterium]
ISNVKFNDKSVEIYEKNVTVNKDDIENGLFKITGTLTGANGVKTFQFSYDGGSSFNNITFLSQTSPYQFTFTFTPKESVEYKFLIKIIASDDREISDNYFGQIEKVTYINKTANDLIKELLTDFCKSYQTNDKTLFLKCVSESFIGNNEGYEDYTSIESSIRNVFNKTATFICLYQNEKINILSPTRAQVDFVFKRTFKFDDIDRTLPLQINASFDLIKEEDAWKILGDKNNLVFMKHFPDIPSTPY